MAETRRRGKVRPEAVLLICCARTRLGAGQSQRVRELAAPGLDWDRLLSLARQHGVVPLLYRNLVATAPDGVPAEVIAELRDEYRTNAIQSLALLDETTKLLTALRREGVQAVPLRGPLMALTTYGDVALRQSVDVDLLVRPGEVPEAARVLESNGCEPEERAELTSAQTRAVVDLGHHARFLGRHCGLGVELHWRPVSLAISPRPDEWRLPEQCRVVWCGGKEVQLLTPDDDLLLSCAHGFKHVFCCLKWVCDIAELARAFPCIDYEQVAAKAQALGCLRAVLTGGLLAGDLLEAPIPIWLLDRARADGAASRFAAAVRRRLESGESGPAGLCSRLQDLGLQLRALGSVRDRVDFLLRRMETQSEADIAGLRLPAALSSLYRFAKLGRPWRRRRAG